MLHIVNPKRDHLAEVLLSQSITSRESWQSTSAPSPVREVSNVVLELPDISSSVQHLIDRTGPDLPWAEEHFLERVSGQPLNPPPSFARWPWHSEKERSQFLTSSTNGGVRFDHTYPERIWPKEGWWAGQDQSGWGDLQDVVGLLRKDPWTRQAFLPIWFPEDTGTTLNQRVPCTLGYHFIRNGLRLDCNYFLRSCDFTRHLHNDLYLAGRLLQWMVDKVRKEDFPIAGNLTVFISNLHLFTADEWRFGGGRTNSDGGAA